MEHPSAEPPSGCCGYYHNVALRTVRRVLRAVIYWVAALALGLCAFATGGLIALRWVDPVTTSVQIQRRIEAWAHDQPYRKQFRFVPLSQIALNLQHAVVAAEDGRFYEHNGIDWKEVQRVVDQDVEEGRVGRGASTITQQLVKNLFLTTNRSYLRKGMEFVMAPVAERILPKNRILELYLNVIEWGPGVYGAEAASRYWYAVPAAGLNREAAARLAALLPAPLRRKPPRMNSYSAEILHRMAQRGW